MYLCGFDVGKIWFCNILANTRTLVLVQYQTIPRLLLEKCVSKSSSISLLNRISFDDGMWILHHYRLFHVRWKGEERENSSILFFILSIENFDGEQWRFKRRNFRLFYVRFGLDGKRDSRFLLFC